MLKEFCNFLYGTLSWVVGGCVAYFGAEIIFRLGLNPLGLIISLMIGSRVGMAFYYKDINGRVSSVDNINYFVWLAGLSIFVGLEFLTDMLMPIWLRYKYKWIDLPIGFFLLIGIWWLMAQWRQNALGWLVNEGFESNKHELERIKRERAGWNKYLEMIKNKRPNRENIVQKVTKAKEPEISVSSEPAHVRPAASWPFPTPGLDKPETEVKTKGSSSQ